MIDNELVKKAYLFDVSRIYGEHILIDLDYLQSIEEELINGGNYLPVLVRRYLSVDYTNHIKLNNGNEKILNMLFDTRRLRNGEAVSDLQQWLKTNNQYKQLLNQEEYQKLNNKLVELKKEYDGLELW